LPPYGRAWSAAACWYRSIVALAAPALHVGANMLCDPRSRIVKDLFARLRHRLLVRPFLRRIHIHKDAQPEAGYPRQKLGLQLETGASIACRQVLGCLKLGPMVEPVAAEELTWPTSSRQPAQRIASIANLAEKVFDVLGDRAGLRKIAVEGPNAILALILRMAFYRVAASG